MPLLNTKCSVCGGRIIFPDGAETVICEYCNRPNARPKSRDTAIIDKIKYANERRNMGEFDEAEESYRRVLESSIEEHEARWGRLLCKYGVIYLEDAASHKRVITCRRAATSIFRDEQDYKMCLSQATCDVRASYVRDAEYIDRIQAEIRRIRRENKPWDAFLCYKETDGYGGKTPDSDYARMLYKRLTDQGYNVFYAPESLKVQAGANYEAAIFAAIADAKVMLAIAMRREYLESTWVRSEWKRYLELADAEEDKRLVPMCCGMDLAEDLPEEFRLRRIQALNINDGEGCLSAVDDILRRAIHGDEEAEEEEESAEAFDRKALDKALYLVEDGRFDEAEGPLNEIIDQAPANAGSFVAEAYMGLCRIHTGISFIKDLYLAKTPLDKVASFHRAMSHADEVQRATWQALLDRQADRIKQERRQQETEERRKFQEELERWRQKAEAERERRKELERQRREAEEARKRQEELERQAEQERQRKKAEAEARRIAEEQERQRREAEEKARRIAEEQERQRREAEEARKRREEQERERREAEAERERQKEQERQRQEAEAERRRQEEQELRKREAEEARRYQATMAQPVYSDEAATLFQMGEDSLEGNPAAAAEYFKSAAELGHAQARCKLGVMYEYGEGVPENKQEAARLYRLAAEQGNAVAQYHLGSMYAKGDVVGGNKRRAARLYRSAADQGFAPAQYTVGLMYYNGEGCKEDRAEALKWLSAAAAGGDGNAQAFLDQHLQQGELR